MAQLIKANGERIYVLPKNGTDFQLKEMQEIVGGFIEIVRLSDDEYMVVDEEGKLKGYEYNMIATDIYRTQTGIVDTIVGDVLVCKQNQIK